MISLPSTRQSIRGGAKPVDKLQGSWLSVEVFLTKYQSKTHQEMFAIYLYCSILKDLYEVDTEFSQDCVFQVVCLHSKMLGNMASL